ncbi:hypothetical protein PTKIN_Ptkin16aG0094100 [Pterospermum kingtungense]
MNRIGDLKDFPPLGSAKSVTTELKASFDASKDVAGKEKGTTSDGHNQDAFKDVTGKEKGTSHNLDFRKLFSNSSMNKSLEFYAPKFLDDEVIVTPSGDVFNEGRDLWNTAMVAQFIGKFASTAILDRILESGPWHVNNQSLIIRKWEPGLKSLDFSLSKVSFWLYLRNVPLELFTCRGLSYIASAIGNPLYMDNFTTERKKLAYAKVCVEIDVSRKIPQYITVDLGQDLWKPKQQGVKAPNVGSGNNSILEVRSSPRGSKNSQGSDVQFSTLLEQVANEKKPTSVAALMDNIKTQVRDSLGKRKFEVDKGKGVLVADGKDVKFQEEMFPVQGRINDGNVGHDAKVANYCFDSTTAFGSTRSGQSYRSC